MQKQLYLKLKEAGIAQKDIATTLGLTQTTVSSRLRGEHGFRATELKKIRDKYFPETPLEDLIDD